MGMGCGVVYGTDDVESCIGLRCKVVYGTGGVESCMGWGARSCMEQVVSNHVWGEMRDRVWNRWCRIVYGVRCEIVYGTDVVESCIWVRCEVVYGTDGVES